MRILYIDIDTLRPDHLGCYGYNRNTSPNIDKIAGKGVRFENYYCSDAPCLPSRTALMTGKFGIHTGVASHGGIAADIRLEGATRSFTGNLSNETLPGLLRQNGLKTITISPFADRHGAWHFYAGFDEMHNTGKKGMDSAEEITPGTLKWIKENASEDNWFLHINYWDPHEPYRTPENFKNPFYEEPLDTWITGDILQEHRNMVGPHKPRELYTFTNKVNPEYPNHPGEINNTDELKKFIDDYDNSIRYADYHFGLLIEELDKQGVLEDLVIIIIYDHGENFGELGIYHEHARIFYYSLLYFHYNLYLLPTIMELIGPDSDDMKLPSWDGSSFAGAITEGRDCSRVYLVLSQCAHVCQRSVRFSDYLYMRTYHDGYHLFPEEMLFNIKEDPHEQHNLAKDNPEIIKKALAYYNEWHNNMMGTMEDIEDPLNIVLAEGGPYHARGKLKEYIEYLKETGRDYAIEELKRRHPEEKLS